VILATKFAHGAWAVCALLPLMVLMLRGICRHHAIVKQAPSMRPNELQALTLPCARVVVADVPFHLEARIQPGRRSLSSGDEAS
jgi:hypothetical protein